MHRATAAGTAYSIPREAWYFCRSGLLASALLQLGAHKGNQAVEGGNGKIQNNEEGQGGAGGSRRPDGSGWAGGQPLVGRGRFHGGRVSTRMHSGSLQERWRPLSRALRWWACKEDIISSALIKIGDKLVWPPCGWRGAARRPGSHLGC